MTDLTTRTKPSAEAVLARSEAEAHDVHAYALKEIAVLEDMIAQLKANIEAKKKQREEASRAYIAAVDDALVASRVMEEAVARIAKVAEEV